MARQTFEDAMRRLEDIVQELEGGELGLDEALKKFQEGIKLSTFCSKKLDEAERKVTVLLKDAEGGITEQPFSVKSDEDEEA